MAATLIALMTYFAVILLTAWSPSLRSTGAFFLYVLSLPLVLVGLLGLGVWGGIGWLSSRGSHSLTRQQHRARLLVALTGLLFFASFWGLASMTRATLPTGSHLLAFDASVWRDPASSEFVSGDITPRQKMSGDLVNTVLPRLNRQEVESLLGPSLETPYFQSTGRDLIYVLGPERDSMFMIDFEWLLIWLDTLGQFERYAIYTD